MNAFEDSSRFGTEFMDTGLKSFAAVSKNVQALATEASDYTRQAYESGAVAMEKLISAKSFDKAVEIQSDYAKQAYEGFVAQASRMGDLYAEMAKQAYKPFESVVARAR